jgi:competence protein ComEC
MFTILGAGRMIGRKACLYNSLAASAMLLCVYDSNYLWDMGFQLSYLALIGIAWLQKPVYRLLFIRQKMGRYVWEMASVTLSAQVFTTPLCLYYFHQFPVYFLFTNLLVVPISTVILCTELFLLLISWWTPAALLTGKLIGWQILLMNAIVDRSNQLPGALIENIPMRLAQEWALYLIVWAAACWWIGRSTLWKNIACMAVMIYLILCIGYRLQTRGQQKLVVYNLRGSSVIEWIHGREGYTLFRKIRGPDSTRIKMLLQQSHLALGIPPVLKNLPGQSFVIGHKKLLIVTSPIRCDQPEKVDILVIAGDPMIDMQKLLECVQPGEILFDAANTLWKIVKWKKDCEELLLQCYSIPESGAYISDLH